MLASAIDATAARDGDSTIIVTLAAPRAGHAFPTGDMFRRLEIRAKVVRGGATAEPVVLARRFTSIRSPTGFERVQIADDRLRGTADPKRVTLTFGVPIESKEIEWVVAYQRMDRAMAGVFGLDESSDEIIVAKGIIPSR
jgi:hypothetical protein